MSSNVWLRVRQSSMSSTGTSVRGCCSPWLPKSTATRSASGYGSGRISTALTTLKIAVLAPMPSMIVRIAMIVKAGRRASVRSA